MEDKVINIDRAKEENAAKEEKKEEKKTTVTVACHTGFKEIYPGLYVGKKYHLDEHNLPLFDVLIPLDSVDSDIWDDGYRKEIMYVPVKDYGVLPKDVEQFYVDKTLELLSKGKKVAIFCIGGHGRTGYFSSLVLGKLGIEDPIKHLRENYCSKAVEDQSQVAAIADFLGHPEWKVDYFIEKKVYYGYGYGGGHNSSYWWNQPAKTDKADDCCKDNAKKNTGAKSSGYFDKCKYCTYWVEFQSYPDFGRCYIFEKNTKPDDEACSEFEDIFKYE